MGVSLLAAMPIILLFGWASPSITADLVRLANSEQLEASKYLGLPERAGRCPRRRRGERATSSLCSRDKAFSRSLQVLLMPIV